MVSRKMSPAALILVIFVVVVLVLVEVASSATENDIEVKITNIWGSNYPIVLFNQSATLGQVVSADLDSSPISEPLPTLTSRPRNEDKSVVSRFKLSDTKVKIVAYIAGGKPYYPGSEGYIKITNSDWKITEILKIQEITKDYSGTGVNIDTNNGIITWSGRGGCSDCGYNENEFILEFIVEKKSVAPVLTVATQIIINSPKKDEYVNWSPEGYSIKGIFIGTIAGLKTYVLVHPLTTTKWWVQRAPIISGSNWESVVYLGTKDAGANENYEIYVITTDKTLNEGAELGALPDYSAMARVTVFRPTQGATLATPTPSEIEKESKLAPAPTATPESSNSYIYAGIGGIFLLLVAIVALKSRGSPKEEKPAKAGTIIKTEPIVRKPEPVKEINLLSIPKTEPEITEKQSVSKAQTKGIGVTSAYGYKGATIQYKVKVENPTTEPVADIKITLFVPDVFLISNPAQNVAMVKPGESKTVTFEIRPTGECGTCEVSGKIVYYDYTIRKTCEIDIPAKNLSIVCPMLQSKEINEDMWRSLVPKLVKAEESTKEIDMPAITLFDIISDIMRDMNLYMLEPRRTESSGLYRATARFYGEGIKGLRYAAQAEVIGGPKKSKLMLKAWAEREDALVGFYHGIWDEIEKRVQVKQYIDTPIVQQFYQYGDRIGTQIKDSVVQRSSIGTSARKCPNCGREVEANEKFCLECGTRLGG